MDWHISRARKGLKGEITVPPDKSVSHRALIFGSICPGTLRVRNFLFADDCLRTLSAFRQMGRALEIEDNDVVIKGNGLKGLSPPAGEIYLGNSGTAMRIIPGVLAGCGLDAVLSGDESLSRRPMGRIVDPLKKMGAVIGTAEGGCPPIMISSANDALRAIEYKTPVASAQVKSCVLAAGLYADGTTSVTEPFQSRDHTERMLEYLSAGITRDGLTTRINGLNELTPRDLSVPGDISSAAFFMVAATLIEGSEVLLRKVGLNPTRKGIVDVMLRMGADIKVVEERKGVEPEGDIVVRFSELKATEIMPEEIPLLIDEIPVLIVAALRARGETILRGIDELKVKESDRVKCMSDNLRKMGFEITEENGCLTIPGSSGIPRSGEFHSFGDHRIAMSMAVASLVADGQSTIRDTGCVETSYPRFMEDLKLIGG